MDILVECTNCKDFFYRRKSDVNKSKKLNNLLFCSQECCKNWKKQFNNVFECFNCGKKITRKPFEVKNSKTKKFYCSSSCSASVSNLNRKLNEHTKQKIKESLINYKINNSEPKQFASCQNCKNDFHQVKKNRKFCSLNCYHISKLNKKRNQISSRTWQKIFVHHIQPRKNGLNNNLDNLILLCPNHHSLITRNMWTPNDLEKFSVNNYFTIDELSQFYGKEQITKEFEIKFLQQDDEYN
jgi:hypothetical protein